MYQQKFVDLCVYANVANNAKKMKNYIYTLFFLSQIFPLVLFGQTSVISYNIRYDNPSDNENLWEYRKSEISQMINYYSPEIIGIQESLNNQVKYLDSTLLDYEYIGVGRGDGRSKGEYTAIFYKTERIKLLSTKTFWLSETPDVVSIGWDASMERIVTFGEFLDKKNYDTLYVFNCHYDHIGKVAKIKSTELILNIMENMGIANKKVILMGDFNSETDDEPIELFKTQMVDNYYKKGVITYGPLGTLNQFNPDIVIKKRIDYIFTKNIKVKEYIHIDDRRKNNLFLSDHLPVLMKIE